MIILVLCIFAGVDSVFGVFLENSTYSYSPLELLCFAMDNPKERARCANRADTECLSERMKNAINPIKDENHCKTDAFAKVDMDVLNQVIQIRCGNKTTDDGPLNTVWVATQVKNDAQSLLEWLVWHFLLGVDHALVYDNESTDNLYEALQPFLSAGLIEIIKFPGIGMQAKAFTDALARAKKNRVDWLAAIDTDEYIVPIQDKCIPTFLQRFYNKREVAGVRLNWQYVNAMGRLWRWENGILDQTLLDRTGFYTGRSDIHVKTIARVARTFKFMDSHYAMHHHGTHAVSPDTGKRGGYHFTNPPQTKTAVLLHMHVRTLEEWIIKRQRGRGSVKTNHCPYCNASLEILTSEWLCFNNGNYGIPDKDGRGQKCKDQDEAPQLNPAPNNWAKPLKKSLSNAMRRQAKLMNAVLIMPIEDNNNASHSDAKDVEVITNKAIRGIADEDISIPSISSGRILNFTFDNTDEKSP